LQEYIRTTRGGAHHGGAGRPVACVARSTPLKHVCTCEPSQLFSSMAFNDKVGDIHSCRGQARASLRTGGYLLLCAKGATIGMLRQSEHYTRTLRTQDAACVRAWGPNYTSSIAMSFYWSVCRQRFNCFSLSRDAGRARLIEAPDMRARAAHVRRAAGF
jgi:hypothetical protein